MYLKRVQLQFLIILIIIIIAYCSCSRNVTKTNSNKNNRRVTPLKSSNSISGKLESSEIDVNVAPPETLHTNNNNNNIINDNSNKGDNEENIIANSDANDNQQDSTTLKSEVNQDENAQSVAEEQQSSPPASENESQSEPPPNTLSRYCKCTENTCNCCRNFFIPLIPVRGPACAKIRFANKEKVTISLQYGDFVLASRKVSGNDAAPICIPLPGGFSKFCARIYGLARQKEGFKACLGLELRADETVEAAMRLSCFRVNRGGLALMEAEAMPPPDTEKDEDDDDLFGFGDDEDDDEEDDADDDY